MREFFSNWRRPARIVEAGPSTVSVDALAAAADAARDARRPVDAAPLYAAALDLAPGRVDLRVQLANMLKDAGDPLGAVAQYRTALAARPDDADALLQLGRALRDAGQMVESVEAFTRSRAINPDLAGAALELLRARAIKLDDPVYRIGPSLDRLGALQATTAALREARSQIDAALARLPDLEMWSAVPPEHYGLLRAALDLPTAPFQPGAEAIPFAIFVDADEGHPAALHALLDGLSRQRLADWRLLATATRPAQRDALARAARGDTRIQLVDADTPAGVPVEAWRLHLPAGGFLHPEALAWLAVAVARHPERAFFFDTEIGSIDRRGVFAPQEVRLGSAADLDALLEADVVGEGLLLPPTSGDLRLAPGDVEAKTALRLDLARAGRLAHLPLPLLRQLAAQPEPGEAIAERRRSAAENWLRAAHPDAAITPPTPLAAPRARWRNVESRIGIVVPSHDNGGDLEAFVDSLVGQARRPHALRMLLIDHAGARADTAASFERLGRRAGVSVLRLDEPFNWSRFNNLGAAALGEDVEALVFANDDMLMLSHSWDEIVADALGRPGVGAVGARLIYPDDLIQHAGVVAGWGEAVDNDGRLRHVGDAGPNQRWRVTRSVAAVVGAFIATRADTFAAVGGFDEQWLPVAFSDVDYCFHLRARGLRTLYSPHLMLRHHESKSRGDDGANADRQARYRSEQAVMERRWGDALRRDPGVHPFWRDLGVPFQLLSICGAQAALDHLDLCASLEPWRLAPPAADEDSDDWPAPTTG